MQELHELIRQTMIVLTPLLPYLSAASRGAGHAAEKEAEKLSDTATIKFLHWIEARLANSDSTRAASDALSRAAEKPESDSRRRTLEALLHEIAEENPEFRGELTAKLRAIKVTSHYGDQTSTQNGDSNVSYQVQGDNISISSKLG